MERQSGQLVRPGDRVPGPGGDLIAQRGDVLQHQLQPVTIGQVGGLKIVQGSQLVLEDANAIAGLELNQLPFDRIELGRCQCKLFCENTGAADGFAIEPIDRIY